MLLGMRHIYSCLISRAGRLFTCQNRLRKMADIAGMRQPYHDKQNVFDVNDLVAKEPYGQFQNWFEEACNISTIEEPNAMALATSTKDGIPSVRMVLMKGYDKRGFVFYSNYESRKASEMKENPRCSLMFYWEPLKRSVRIEGGVECVSLEESLNYFSSRPRTSQLGAIVSHQSKVIPDRAYLDKTYQELLSEYSDESKPIVKPECWGGYRVVPTALEFWQGQTNRLHDRLRFRRPGPDEIINKETTLEVDDGWLLERLSP